MLYFWHRRQRTKTSPRRHIATEFAQPVQLHAADAQVFGRGSSVCGNWAKSAGFAGYARGRRLEILAMDRQSWPIRQSAGNLVHPAGMM
jgi:hypothetical protein